MITETHFTPNTNFKLYRFTTHVTNHPNNTAHVGTAIFVSSRIHHCLLPPYQEHAIQATNIQINVDSIPIILLSVYCPPNHNKSKNKFNSLFNILGNTFIVGGDFNAKHNTWGCRVENQICKTLFQTITDNHFSVISPPGPTYWSTHLNRHPDTLDYFVTKLPNHLTTLVNNICDLSSDHSPVILTLRGNPTHNIKPSLTDGPINWTKFKNHLDNSINLNITLKTCNGIECAATLMVKTNNQQILVLT
jgi:exonuclease III